MSKVDSLLRITPFAILFLMVSAAQAQPAAQAQGGDWHTSARALFVKSPFAHGYMHGYEEGFHNGDMDLQMGRSFRAIKDQQEYKKIVGYNDDYGDKKEFERGYRAGFGVGYTDSYAGRSFRAVQLVDEVKEIPHVTPSTFATARFDSKFDTSFREGYETGQHQGLADGRVSDVSRLEIPTCGPKDGHAPAYAGECDAFTSGYRLGYSDGFTNQRGTMGESVARNSDTKLVP